MLPQIRMEQTYALLGLNVEKPVQEIRQPSAELNLRQEPAILKIDQELGVLTIDTTEARANIDMKGVLRRSREYADYGRQKTLEAIARISQEGDRLREIERGGSPISEISFENSTIYDNVFIIKGNWTDDGVAMSYQKRDPEIHVEVRGMRMNPVIHPPEIRYTPGKVESYLRQKNSLTIDVVGLELDRFM